MKKFTPFTSLDMQSISVRELLREYKEVVKLMQKRKQPIIVTSEGKKQLAIITIEDLEILITAKLTKSGHNLLTLHKQFDKLHSKESTPSDLAVNHDHYAWGMEKKNNL